MYYAEIKTVSDSYGAILVDNTLVGMIRGLISLRKEEGIEAEDLEEVEIRVRDTDLIVLKAKFLEQHNALEIYY